MRKEMLNLKNMRPINREIAGQVATLASRFDCTFVMEFANSIVNMKSMLGLLSQMLPMNESVVLRTEGEGENEAMDAMLKLLKEYEKKKAFSLPFSCEKIPRREKERRCLFCPKSC